MVVKSHLFGLTVFSLFIGTESVITYSTHEIDIICGPKPLILFGTDSSSMIIKSSYNASFKGPLDCQVFVASFRPKFGIIALIKQMDLKSHGPDCQDYVRLTYDGALKETPKLCNQSLGIYISRPPLYQSVHILYHREAETRNRSFEIVLTQYKLGRCNTTMEFKCHVEGRCISKRLKCDTINNCGDKSDEKCGAVVENWRIGAVIGGIMVSVVSISIAITVFLLLRRKRTTETPIFASQSSSPSSDTYITPAGTTYYPARSPSSCAKGKQSYKTEGSGYQRPLYSIQ